MSDQDSPPAANHRVRTDLGTLLLWAQAAIGAALFAVLVTDEFIPRAPGVVSPIGTDARVPILAFLGGVIFVLMGWWLYRGDTHVRSLLRGEPRAKTGGLIIMAMGL